MDQSTAFNNSMKPIEDSALKEEMIKRQVGQTLWTLRIWYTFSNSLDRIMIPLLWQLEIKVLL